MSSLRLHQAILIVSSLLLAWLGMLATHEFGHVLGAWATGGHVKKVVLHPLTISRTDVSPNPAPLTVVWGGPLVGCVLPMVVFLFCRHFQFRGTYWFQFFAGICLIANGAYIGIGSFEGIGDAGVMLNNGSSMWHLWAFGLVALTTGLKVCNGLGLKFGFGASDGEVSKKAAYLVLTTLIVVVLLELTLSPSE